MPESRLYTEYFTEYFAEYFMEGGGIFSLHMQKICNKLSHILE